MIISSHKEFPHLSQTLQALCDRPLCQAGTPHGPACRSRFERHQVSPTAWRWSSSHCRCLLSAQSHTEGEGDVACPCAERTVGILKNTS